RGDDVVDVAAEDRERELTYALGLRAIGDRSGSRDPHDRARAERLLSVVASLGFDADDPAPRCHRAHRERGAGQQAAASERYEQMVELADFGEQLAGCGALAGNDIGVIERWDDRSVALRCDLLSDDLAILCDAVIEDDLGAVAARRAQLDRGCVAR